MLTARSNTSETPAPSGRDEVTEALLSATASLCTQRLPDSVSIRDVAREAAVAPGLVYHYFGSKDGLLRATVDLLAIDITRVAAEEQDAAEMVKAVCRYLIANPAFSRILSWMALEGRTVTDEMGGHPFIQVLATKIAEQYPGDDVLDRIGVAVTTLMAGGLLVPQVNQTLGRTPDDEALVELLASMIAGAVQGAVSRPD